MERVVVRFAPSPTGDLHLGGARTALFNYLFARSQQGIFRLRIEDTDLERSTAEATRVILEGLRWLGMDWDGEPVYQSQRFDLYRTAAERLFAEGQAYYCHCTREELDARRKEAEAQGLAQRYDRKCRDLGLSKAGGALRFKTPLAGETRFADLLRGEITYRNEELDDFVLLRSDGFPLYNFCVVVDDAGMGVTHVLRGDDHINNTPRQVLVYQALGLPVPQFAHFPMIKGRDGGRLSKRHGATSVLAYRDAGILPEALFNYLARLSWAAGDQEIFSRRDLVEKFSLAGVSLSAAVFDAEKLDWLNAQHLKALTPLELGRRALPFLRAAGFDARADDPLLPELMAQVRERARTLREVIPWVEFYYRDQPEMDPQAAAKFLTPETADLIEAFLPVIEACQPFTPQVLEEAAAAFLSARDLKLGALGQPLRVALTGKTNSPGIFDVLYLVGRARAAARLRRAIERGRGGAST